MPDIKAGVFVVRFPEPGANPAHADAAVVIGMPGPHGGRTKLVQVQTGHGWMWGLACSAEEWQELSGAIVAGELALPRGEDA